MLTRPFSALPALFLVLLTFSLLPSCAFAQAGAPVASAADLQLEIRRLRKRSDSLRGELKRQQKAVGTVRHESEAQQARLAVLETESGRLREQAEGLRRWLLTVGALSGVGLVFGLRRRSEPEGPPAPLAIARERTGRLHDGLTALEARIQVIERRSSEG